MLPSEGRIGTVVGRRYRLESVIGRGGVATVYLAKDLGGGRKFVVKLLDPDQRPFLNELPDLKSRFFLEASIAKFVKHSGIGRIFEEGVAEDGSPYIVMEHLEGTSAEFLAVQRGPWAAETVIELLDQLLDVLAATHSAGIVHHDIKPANLFITTSGCVKLLDFGVSSLTFRDEERNTAITGAGAMLMGTPTFCAPEICRGTARARQDPRTDIYSVGATAFTLLTGQSVHGGETALEMVYRAATMPAPRISETAIGVPQSLAMVVDRALAFDPNQRWQTAATMRDAVHEARRSLPGLESGPSILALLCGRG